jgi:transcriptional/translational regulatory protein YebC/TACO1
LAIKELTAEQVDEVEKLLEKIEEDDEVQNVFSQHSGVIIPAN